MAERSDHDELVRSRDRLHELEKSCWGLHQGQKAILSRLMELEPKVNQLARKDEIAEAVAAKLKSEHRLVFSSLQKVGGFVAFGLLLSDTARSWFS